MTIPGDVSGLMLVDTGARDTCIADDVARDLGLTPIQKIKAQGVGGVSEHPLYLVAFAVAFRWPNGQQFVIERSSPAMGVFDLDKALAQFSLSAGPDGWPVRVLGLLGRDFLRRVVMIYDGCAGEVHLEVQPKSP